MSVYLWADGDAYSRYCRDETARERAEAQRRGLTEGHCVHGATTTATCPMSWTAAPTCTTPEAFRGGRAS